MKNLLGFSRFIDGLNAKVGRAAYWLVLAAILVSAGNAVSRKTLNLSSNAWLELQWYLFSGVFLLCAGYTLLKDGHVRIDVLASRLSPRAMAWVDLFGTVFFLLPMAGAFIYFSVPIFLRTLTEGEISGSAGGLPLWPARLLVPIGFSLLALQGVSEFIKRVAFLRGLGPDPRAARSEAAA